MLQQNVSVMSLVGRNGEEKNSRGCIWIGECKISIGAAKANIVWEIDIKDRKKCM